MRWWSLLRMTGPSAGTVTTSPDRHFTHARLLPEHVRALVRVSPELALPGLPLLSTFRPPSDSDDGLDTLSVEKDKIIATRQFLAMRRKPSYLFWLAPKP